MLGDFQESTLLSEVNIQDVRDRTKLNDSALVPMLGELKSKLQDIFAVEIPNDWC